MISRSAWRAIKIRLRRTPAFATRAAERRAIRRATSFLLNNYPELRAHVHVVPISTMQWSSVVIQHLGARVAFIDVEQANALGLLLLRSFWAERPIIAEIDFLIRASEVFYDDGDIPLAISIAERANQRLCEYCAHENSGDIITRPKIFDSKLIDILGSGVLVAFITGHEIGHLAQFADVTENLGFMEWVEQRFEELKVVPLPADPSFAPIANRLRFISPEIVQKFTDTGVPNGFASYGSKLAATHRTATAQLIREVQADAVGVISATDAAMQGGIEADLLFMVLLNVLEHTEMLMLLRRLVPRLPRGSKRASIAFEGTNLGARLIHFVRLIHGIRSDEIVVPPEVAAYWKSLSNDQIAAADEFEASGHFEQVGERASVVARGAVEVGLYGKLASHIAAGVRRADFGILAGVFVMAEAHRGNDIAHYTAEAQYGWTPEAGIAPLLAGFGAAIRDITDVVANEIRPRDAISRADIHRDGNDAAFVELLRSGRSQIVRMQRDPNWSSGFDTLLRVKTE